MLTRTADATDCSRCRIELQALLGVGRSVLIDQGIDPVEHASRPGCRRRLGYPADVGLLLGRNPGSFAHVENLVRRSGVNECERSVVAVRGNWPGQAGGGVADRRAVLEYPDSILGLEN